MSTVFTPYRRIISGRRKLENKLYNMLTCLSIPAAIHFYLCSGFTFSRGQRKLVGIRFCKLFVSYMADSRGRRRPEGRLRAIAIKWLTRRFQKLITLWRHCVKPRHYHWSILTFQMPQYGRQDARWYNVETMAVYNCEPNHVIIRIQVAWVMRSQ